MVNEPEYELLTQLNKTLTDYPKASQRDLATAINMSLGMTNALLKRFAEKGWICVNKISSKNIQYILTPTGLNELAHRSYRYLKKTMKTVIDYKDLILSVIKDCKEKGINEVVLVGSTNIQFIIEYACSVYKLPLTVCPAAEQFNSRSETNSSALVLISDEIQELPELDFASDVSVLYLAQIVVV